MPLTISEHIYVGGWLILLIVNMMAYSLLVDLVALARKAANEGEPPPDRRPIPAGTLLLFSGCRLDSPGEVVTERELQGLPATIVILRPPDNPSLSATHRVTSLLGALSKRARGRLWVCCDGTRAACAAMVSAASDYVEPGRVILGPCGPASAATPSDGAATIINLDGDGRVVAQGYEVSSS